MMTPIPIPDRLADKLSTRARRIMGRESIRSCEELLALRETDIFFFKGSGRKTVWELTHLQRRILEVYPDLLPHYYEPEVKKPKVTPPPAKMPDQGATAGPADWSVLCRTFPDLFQLSHLPFPCKHESGTTIGALGLPAADLERLRSIAVFPEDSVHLLYSSTTGYLLEAGLSDAAISILLASLMKPSAPAAAARQSAFVPEARDYSLYAGLPSGLVDPLVVPGFPFPELLGTADRDKQAVPWGAVAKITERAVIGQLGFSATALRAIRYLWQLQERAVSVAESARAGLPTKAYGDFAEVAEGYLQLALAKKLDTCWDREHADRYRQVLRGRLRLNDDRKRTLTELGKQFGVTRERIRQMESKLLADLKSPETRRHLDYLWHLLDQLLASGGGARYLRELSVSLRDLQRWACLPPEEGLASIMELSPLYRVDREPPMRAALTVTCCVGCATGGQALIKALETAPDKGLSVEQALEIMQEVCLRERCPELRKITGFSRSLFHYLPDMTVLSERVCWRNAQRRHTACSQIVEKMVLSGANSVHYKEVHRQYHQAVPGASITEGGMYRCLSKNPSLLLWGRGTFTHRELVRVPRSLIVEIQQDVLARLDSGDIPYLCLNGIIFDNYRKRLQPEGVPNPVALYTCMRIVGSAVLSFVEYPYALKKDGPGLRLPIAAVLESVVSSRMGVVATEQIRAFAIMKLGVPEVMVGAEIGKIRNVQRVANGLWLHCRNVGRVTNPLGK